MAINKISEAILEKVKLEARDIISDAEAKALERMNQATQQQEERFEAEKEKLVREAEGEAARINAQASIKSRQELSTAKAQLVEEIINQVKKELNATGSSEVAMMSLIQASISQLGVGKAVIYVAPAAVSAVQKLAQEKDLADKIIDVRECKCTGGVIAEDESGKNRIDNTYEARLEKLLPKILPEISKELFTS